MCGCIKERSRRSEGSGELEPIAVVHYKERIMNSYQSFIAKSRYSRYLPEKKRREEWDETVDRWIDFFKNHVGDKVSNLDFEVLRTAIRGLEVLPSMRSIMTAGPALDRTHVAAYNCSYLPVDDWRSFDEAMYILLCGTGVGFSVEEQYVSKLPEIMPKIVRRSDIAPIVVEDSKEGWCRAYRELLAGLFSGMQFDWDVRNVRPAGAPLKTFGGRASGPEPLVDLFEFTIAKFKKAVGRKLTSLEAHDIMCKIGEVVVVGGVRRSAMISLGDLGDFDHATAKSGQWWELHPERALANNSAVYQHKPSIGEFMKEWLDIYNSHSGERGIFNREASRKQASKYGRRPANVEYGTNPCSEIILAPYQFCNLSTVVVKPTDTLLDLKDKIELATMIGTIQSTLTNFDYLRPIWKETTEREGLLGVSMTGVFDNELFLGPNRKEIEDELREEARRANEYWANVLGIKPSAAVTCIKPEGTVSQLTLTSSGLHPSHAPYYIRRVRQDKKDPMTQFLIDQGIPNEPCVMKPDQTVVFSFPMKAEGLTRKDITAIEHLNIWLDFQRHYCEHKPSVTISVKEDEWMEVGAWVWEHFDECTGISFLPDDGGTYRQAPYEEITEEQFKELNSKMPEIDWTLFIEDRDNVEGAQTLACTAGGCAI
jgi:ribonucleoside-diphosphate reductase alpha chain